MRCPQIFLAASVLLLLWACPGEPNASPILDGAASGDGSAALDSSVFLDASSIDAVFEDAAVLDAETQDGNAGLDSNVLDVASQDAGLSDLANSPDTAIVQADAGLPPQGDNVIVNGSFELWNEGLPEGWMGESTNMTTDNIAEDSHAHDGVKSCLVVNPDSSHLRLSTAAATWIAGRYHCTYWVRGGGEIRNARYNGGYSSYSDYISVDDDQWQALSYDFNLADDVPDVFELIFSVKNTLPGLGHLQLDDVRCTRDIEACDSISCEDWQQCDNDLQACVSADGFCTDAGECEIWQDCDEDHRCVTAADHCANTADCDQPTPVCDGDRHVCEAGDPCADVDCPEDWRVCDPATALCVLDAGRCLNTLHCDGDLPVCNITNHSCEAIDSVANVVPNGGFELWEDLSFNGSTVSTVHLPQYWYGVCVDCSPYFPTSTAAFSDIAEYTLSTHGGDKALQLSKDGQPADRFASEPFSLQPTTTYSCAYWVRGHGNHRQRAYCGGWTPDTEFLTVDSSDWQQVGFEINSNSSWCVLIFYISNTDADLDHVQIDDVSCAKKF